jgi:hypothetical protein
LLGKFESVIHLNTKVPNGAFELVVAEQELAGPEVAGASVQ